MVWAFQNYSFSFSYDQIHEQRDQLFRVDIYKEKQRSATGICPMPLPCQPKRIFSSVEEVVRYDRQNIAVKSGREQPYYENIHFVDPTFFELFDFPMVVGSSDISDKTSIVITDEMAEKYFGVSKNGCKDILGETMIVYSGKPHQKALTVVGVIEKNPINSSVWFQMLTHFENQYNFKMNRSNPMIGAGSWMLYF